MGSSYIFKCLNCKKKIEIQEGIGFLYSQNILVDYNNKFNLLRHYKNGTNKTRLEEILKKQKHVLTDNYGLKTYQCPNCKNISSELYFKLKPLEDNDTEFISEYQCCKCKTKLKKIDNLEKCPFCGGEFDKENIEIMMWD